MFRGYVEVNIGGKVRPLKFGMNQLALFSQKINKPLDQIVFGVTELRELVWSGLCSAARSAGEKFEHDEWDVGDWLDEIEPAELQKILDAVTASLPEEDQSKKKAVQ